MICKLCSVLALIMFCRIIVRSFPLMKILLYSIESSTCWKSLSSSSQKDFHFRSWRIRVPILWTFIWKYKIRGLCMFHVKSKTRNHSTPLPSVSKILGDKSIRRSRTIFMPCFIRFKVGIPYIDVVYHEQIMNKCYLKSYLGGDFQL